MTGLREGSVPIFIQQPCAILQRVPRIILLTNGSSDSHVCPTACIPDQQGKRGCILLYTSFLGTNGCKSLTRLYHWGKRSRITRTHIQRVQGGYPSIIYFSRESCFPKSTELVCKLTCQQYTCFSVEEIYLSQRKFLPLRIIHEIDARHATR